MNIAVTADSTCDLTKELCQTYDVGIIPLWVVLGDKAYRDTIDITYAELFEFAESGKGKTGTTAVNIEEYTQFFQKQLEGRDALIHINISSELSICYQNAKIAAEQFDNVYVIDSWNLSTASGYLALRARELSRSGMDPQSIVSEIENTAKYMNASFVINTLDYLKRGGRCSPLVALGANMLNLKPCIEVEKGKMDVGKKYRGSLKKCILKYVEDVTADTENFDPSRIFVTHSIEDRDIVDSVKEYLRQQGFFAEILETRTGCTISNHCGPGTLGVLFCNKH